MKVGAPVLLPAFFRLISADRMGFSIGDSGDSIRGNAGVDQKISGGIGAEVAKAKIVLFASTLVAMAFERECFNPTEAGERAKGERSKAEQSAIALFSL